MDIDVQYALEGTDIDKNQIPNVSDFYKWASAALSGKQDEAHLSIRIVDENEISQLNQTYRHKHGPTNVLSFPADLARDVPLPLLGDIVICAPIVISEATQQEKNCTAHWAHMTVHGTLHLMGYDHENEEEANVMENLEIEILDSLGFDNPYQEFHENITT